MPKPLLDIDALTAGYTRPVVGPLSFRLARSEILGVVGPNACGKSTLLAALTGSARIFSGQIGKAAGVQISLQQQQPPAIDGLPINATDLLALTGASPEELPPWLSTQLGKRLDRLSGGQLQFLYLWSCLLAAADVVLLDEPTNNLDPEGTIFLERVLQRRADAGCGLLVVSHDQRFINAVCHRKISLG